MQKVSQDSCFHPFNTDVRQVALPTAFTFPFLYSPHPLAIAASKQIQAELLHAPELNHAFGITPNSDVDSGKMFGVLVVKKPNGDLGFLKAFSGKLANTYQPTGFVPHVYDLLPGRNFFEVGMEGINAITAKIKAFEKDPAFATTQEAYENLEKRATQDLTEVKQQLIDAKAERAKIKKQKKEHLSEADFSKLVEKLNTESIQKKFYFKHLQEHWEEKLTKTREETEVYYHSYLQWKTDRKEGSNALQKQIFEHYEFLNAKGETQNLCAIFEKEGIHLPPAGAGDCAAPKLIQYAYKMGYQPIVMAEFWWGKSPKSEIKKHGHYYPACTGKCQPILGHMLKGLETDPNPMETATMEHLHLETVYEDTHMMVVNKPSGLLSVPGKSITDSVVNRLKTRYPNWTGPLIVHRLDMPTSGLMLVAKTLEIHKELQKQFLDRSIKKRYIAVLDGLIAAKSGEIDLPLRVDLDNRPHQMVCFDHGKKATTRFEVISTCTHTTRIYFYPITGRTHQLRMHAAHKEGLNVAIVGDALYGQMADRLHLHAEQIEFQHPVSGKTISLQIDPEF